MRKEIILSLGLLAACAPPVERGYGPRNYIDCHVATGSVPVPADEQVSVRIYADRTLDNNGLLLGGGSSYREGREQRYQVRLISPIRDGRVHTIYGYYDRDILGTSPLPDYPRTIQCAPDSQP